MELLASSRCRFRKGSKACKDPKDPLVHKGLQDLREQRAPRGKPGR